MLNNLLDTAIFNVGKFENVSFLGRKLPCASQFAFLQTIYNVVSYALIPLFIAVAAGGAIYAIVLGVNLARAAESETRDAAKKRLIWAIVALASMIVLIILISWVLSMIPGWIQTYQVGDVWMQSETQDGWQYFSKNKTWEQLSESTTFQASDGFTYTWKFSTDSTGKVIYSAGNWIRTI